LADFKLPIITRLCKKAATKVPDRENLEKRRKQMLYRATHRGIKEMDIILGGFAGRYIGDMNELQLDELENLMDHNDLDLLQWFTACARPPVEINSVLFQKILAYANSCIPSSS